MRFGALVDWVREHEREAAVLVSGLGLLVALVSMLVALFQAILLYGERATPYETAIYVRQLEVAEDFAGAAHEQWLQIINLHNDCVHRANGDVAVASDYLEISKDFRRGSQTLHMAYAATLASFPQDVHDDAYAIWSINETLFDQIVAPAADCGRFLFLYRQTGAEQHVENMDTRTREFVNAVRSEMRIDPLSWPEAMRSAPPNTPAKPN